MMKAFSKLTVLCLLALAFHGCASKSINESDPGDLYKDAETDISNDRYLLALDKLRIVKSKFSYSSYGALAQMRIGDVYFLQESYPEAASAYETFVELYPKHEKAGYGIFRAGESYFMDIPSTIARDLRSAESAINSFTSYLKKYPTGEYAKKAKDFKAKAYNKLAEKEFDIAQFYIRRKKADAARTRLQKILDLYGESEVAVKAKELLKSL
ncbi:MAG: outer membrane protein assembly factor BamD [Bdellovibrionales bacterium]|nr:outer membrane protein assembly factor BamD [Bdellovibrionales bacterium]